MENTRHDLEHRGYLDLNIVTQCADFSDDALVKQLNAKTAQERTAAVHVGARRWNYEPWFVDLLLKQLMNEKALYTRLEICRVLEGGNNDVAAAMMPYLGEIGHNQHQNIPKAVSRKRSYPLPRDIIARTLGNMNAAILYTMIDSLGSLSQNQVSEFVDAYGYFISEHPHLATQAHLNVIEYLINTYADDDLILWKCMQCLSVFPLDRALEILNSQYLTCDHPTIQSEIKRSIHQISRKREAI
ncbi:hypothetical protein [Erysipelothrix sp. strain 2 (EsS2-6-Brazil)]|uniref:hypothetical protein n=1 Tax=Erysipelothrix sp. strain 2 (EsS2-6-Brazil) TaxID=2500549 RepID=UPI0013790DF3|nr:hypothetical protein [Erysipelothrix sp. strain 2 (EsS2-6-Brazil)]MBK2401780.1 hypothetical protein [Erysipelothrix sp. strain 2 (EsS2-6-Brazil)]NBA00868.1 hypothetical protein [Erysipelothrix rhusiopathiae]